MTAQLGDRADSGERAIFGLHESEIAELQRLGFDADYIAAIGRFERTTTAYFSDDESDY